MLFPVILVLLAFSFTTAQQCNAGGTSTFSLADPANPVAANFGCCGVNAKGVATWLSPVGAECTITINPNISFYYNNMFLNIGSSGGKNVLLRYAKNGNLGSRTWTGMDMVVSFEAGQSDRCPDTRFYGTYLCKPGPKVHSIESSTSYIVTNASASGFVYLSLPKNLTVDGKMFTVKAVTEAYKGLKPPGFFIARNYLPSLEFYDFTNNSVSSGSGSFSFNFAQADPIAAHYVIAMFAYGRFASVIFEASWTYNYPKLNNEEVYPLKITNTKPWISQIQLAPNNKKILFEFSREEPGGTTTVLIGTGYTPTESRYAAKKIINSAESFGDIKFDRPVAKGDNPGLFIVRLQTNNATAGALFKASWN